MKNVMVAIRQQRQEAPSFADIESYIRAQIENSLEVGWTSADILLLANFDYRFMGVTTQRIRVDDARLTSSKAFAMYALAKTTTLQEPVWSHDLDAWQNSWFDCPPFRDIGICQYSDCDQPNFNGGSVFYRPTAKDIMAVVHVLLSTHKNLDEEAVFNKVLGAPAYKHWVTVLNSTYNVGCDNFEERCEQSDKPIYVCHFHPDRHANAKVHLLGQNALQAKTVNERLGRLLGRYFDIPTRLNDPAGVLGVEHRGTAPA
jgi:hypothetical protein